MQMMRLRRLRLAGHVLRQPEERHANIAMNWLPKVEKDLQYARGRREKTWRTTFAEDLQNIGVTWTGAQRVATITRDG